MRWRDYGSACLPEAASTADISVQHRDKAGRALPSVVVTAKLDGHLVGVCEGHSFGLWGDSDVSHETVVLGPMDVEDDFQGRGWGKVLSYTMLAEARTLGYRHCATSTQQDNHRAQLFYTNMGFEVTDVAHSYLLDL